MKPGVRPVYVIMLGLIVIAMGCGRGVDRNAMEPDEFEVHIIGDSIFDYSGDIQYFLSVYSGKVYVDHSMTGAKIEGIVTQYERAIREYPGIRTIIADGGGNNILINRNVDCDTDPLSQDCLDELAYVRESVSDLWERMYQDGVETCIFLNYYYTTGDYAEGNEALDYQYEQFEELVRNASLNSGPGGLYFLDPRSLITPDMIIEDGIHPNEEGSEVLAQLIWDTMVEYDVYK